MPALLTAMSIASILFSGAIFGFFYAWVCSTMWGLDAADPRIAIAAMQAMNASVRNVAFAPAFFLTPAVTALTGVVALMYRRKDAALWFFAAAATYLAFGLVLTATANVPMNEALAREAVPDDIEAARLIWDAYSQSWQVWNLVRTVASGVALVFCAIGLIRAKK
ncbi:MAG: DUF1772 domain-containing protein [Aquamicrobium sp.]|uniref:anthrone oxygenase family protein n=1 Tax=Aquamicrobium sp. TaxID=1872579 RepID=UPI00349E6714|nr:DUF1772 domain-containing protein [Aquamicrobium sp.]